MTFYEDLKPHNPVHTPMATLFDTKLRSILIDKAAELEYKFHKNGTVITIEGSKFSTIAESKMFKLWGADTINMSISTEAILAGKIFYLYLKKMLRRLLHC